MTSIFERRLIVVTGKGGTGKTTVAACLALAAAERGLRVAVAETGRDEQLVNLFGDPKSAGYPGREIRPGLHVLRLDPFEALAEYLELELVDRVAIPLPGISRRLLSNPSFRSWLLAVPGWRELITLGKLWHLEQQTVDGRPRFDCIVVDAPATGHGLTFLDVPRVAVSAVRGGPLRRHAAAVEALVLDPARTVVLPVSLAEELPVSETCELVERLRTERGVSVDRIVVNALEPQPDVDLAELATQLEALPAELAGAPAPHDIAACARHLKQRVDRQSEQHLRLQRTSGLPTVALPRLATGVSGPDDLARLGRALLPGIEA